MDIVELQKQADVSRKLTQLFYQCGMKPLEGSEAKILEQIKAWELAATRVPVTSHLHRPITPVSYQVR